MSPAGMLLCLALMDVVWWGGGRKLLSMETVSGRHQGRSRVYKGEELQVRETACNCHELDEVSFFFLFPCVNALALHPFWVAALRRARPVPVVDLLLRNAADVGLACNNGATPLHGAVESCTRCPLQPKWTEFPAERESVQPATSLFPAPDHPTP